MEKNKENKPKGIFSRWFDKLDKTMEEKSKSQCCCCAPKKEEDKSCCK